MEAWLRAHPQHFLISFNLFTTILNKNKKKTNNVRLNIKPASELAAFVSKRKRKNENKKKIEEKRKKMRDIAQISKLMASITIISLNSLLANEDHKTIQLISTRHRSTSSSPIFSQHTNLYYFASANDFHYIVHGQWCRLRIFIFFFFFLFIYVNVGNCFGSQRKFGKTVACINAESLVKNL